ncbi:MAG: hypothetical protein ACJA1H_000452 [Glaciecola sp.]|jgi:hypothetical protein
MKKSKILIGAAVVTMAGFFAIAADHIDAPAVAGGTSDIADFMVILVTFKNHIIIF